MCVCVFVCIIGTCVCVCVRLKLSFASEHHPELTLAIRRQSNSKGASVLAGLAPLHFRISTSLVHKGLPTTHEFREPVFSPRCENRRRIQQIRVPDKTPFPDPRH